jgi:hypothetical protein
MPARLIHATRRVAAALALIAAAVPAVAAAAGETQMCTTELAAMDRSFAQGLVRVLMAGTPAEQCAALANQLQAIVTARDVQVRCRMPGAELDGVLAMLSASALDFQEAQARLACNVPA